MCLTLKNILDKIIISQKIMIECIFYVIKITSVGYVKIILWYKKWLKIVNGVNAPLVFNIWACYQVIPIF